MGNGFTYNIAKGPRYYHEDFYNESGELYRYSERATRLKREGLWWETLRFSLSLAYKL